MKRTIKTMAESRKTPVRATRTMATMLLPEELGSSEGDVSDVTPWEVFEEVVVEPLLSDDTFVVVEPLLLSFDGVPEELESVFSLYTEQSVPSSQTQKWPA